MTFPCLHPVCCPFLSLEYLNLVTMNAYQSSVTNLFQVAAGGTHSVVLTHEGHVWTWGQPWPPGDMYAFPQVFQAFFCLLARIILFLSLQRMFFIVESKFLLLYEYKDLKR